MKKDLDRFMKENQIDALWVSGPLQHNPDMVYFTGIHHVTGADLIKKIGQPPILNIISQMEREEGEKSGLETRTLDEKFPLDKYFRENDGDVAKAIAARLRDVFIDMKLSAGRIAVFGKKPFNQAKSLLDHLEVFLPEVDFTGVFKDSPIELARTTKGKDEIDRIRKMGKLTTAVVARTQEYLTTQKVEDSRLVNVDGKPIRIRDVKKNINLWLAESSADNPEETIFAIGRDAGIPHSAGNPDDFLELGKPIVFDIFPCEAGGGYFYDFTRTWCLGFAPDAVKEIHQQVLTIHHQIIKDLQENTLYRNYQQKTCEMFKELGHPTIADSYNIQEGYVHSIGHGLGLDVHENPFSGLTSTERDVLIEGVVFTIEPGLYYPSRGFGVRIEDTICLNAHGKFEVMAEYPYDLVLPMKTN
jgi:Xaa-Pro aminopeptidase